MINPKDIKTIEELRKFTLSLPSTEVAFLAELLLAIAFELGTQEGLKLSAKMLGISKLPSFEAQA